MSVPPKPGSPARRRSPVLSGSALAALAFFVLTGEARVTAASDATPAPTFENLPGWEAEDHAAALAAFRALCSRGDTAPKTRALGVDGRDLAALCDEARALPETISSADAKAFFETRFDLQRLTVGAGAGFLTGYFEPELDGSRERTPRFSVPLYRRPDDLVKVTAANRPDGLDPVLELARKTPAGLVEHPDRAEIEAGALAGRGLELVYLADPLDAFFTHIQGSARIRLTDGSVMRVAYAGKSGHPYTAIGRFLIENGTIAREAMTMETLRAWLVENPDKAKDLINRNRSYIFFRKVDGLKPEAGPVGAAGVQLVAGRSLAVDRRLHTFGAPIWLSGAIPISAAGTTGPFARLTIASDTGSAIVGAARGDLFVGSGSEAGRLAGAIRHPVDMVMLVPRPPSGKERGGEHAPR
ncbi:MAG: transglycosylase [Hyphomicrobiales bacterium]|nr:MAG: transglycosylase [Hyphomicrobiales bacterium]